MTRKDRHPGSRITEASQERIETVYLTCFQADFSFLGNVLQYSGIHLHKADTLDEADFLLTVTDATVLLSDTAFLDGSWRHAIAMAAEMHPMVATLLIADPVDRPFLSDAYTRGACGALWKPIDFSKATDLIRVADQASHDRALVQG